ncbi:hypothetical protein ACFLRF_00025 [Candidatus Altiarchaeota archaeon]
MPVKERQPVIDVIDLGFEDAIRLKELSSRKHSHDKVFIGFERPGIKDRVEGGRDNLELRWGGVLEELAQIKDESVKIVNADFLFSEFYATKWKVFYPGAQVDEASLGDLGWKGNLEYPQKIFAKMKTETVKEVGRILVPNGRFYITEYADSIPFATKRLDEQGFTHTQRDLTEEEMDQTSFMRKIVKHLKAGKVDPEVYWPVRITARKKA